MRLPTELVPFAHVDKPPTVRDRSTSDFSAPERVISTQSHHLSLRGSPCSRRRSSARSRTCAALARPAVALLKLGPRIPALSATTSPARCPLQPPRARSPWRLPKRHVTGACPLPPVTAGHTRPYDTAAPPLQHPRAACDILARPRRFRNPACRSHRTARRPCTSCRALRTARSVFLVYFPTGRDALTTRDMSIPTPLRCVLSPPPIFVLPPNLPTPRFHVGRQSFGPAG
ncbi:hypothetical protein EXIGLDRAFT_241458 [Exidia glandulosa HHB12029]|uniref:Uncharacterized protein n=1 Tax=Exidia glandulosa HHB12029 TaxID=1314781 RepID=A0A165Q6Z1_EXIGL|nr:hypothetical protein EXIGLDRAFT_241458 [Exidia glandulosa HHB12029]